MLPTQDFDTKDCIAPNSVAHELADNVMPAKANFRKTKTLALAIAAGALIAFGAQVSLTVMTGVETLSWGLAKLIGAMTFSTGLMMVVLTGAELFTGNVMMTFSVIEKKTSLAKLLRNWWIVYLGNFIGALTIACLVNLAGECHNAHEMLGVSGQCVHISPLAFSINGVEGQGGFSASAQTGDNDKLAARDG